MVRGGKENGKREQDGKHSTSDRAPGRSNIQGSWQKTIKEELGDWTMAEEVNRRFKAGCGDVEVETRTRQAIAGKIQKRSKKEGERLEAERAKPTLATNDSDLEFVNMET